MQKSHLLSQALLRYWENYARLVQLSSAKASTKHIHQLRISTQKLEAILTLVSNFVPKHQSKKIIDQIRKVRKSVNLLRDSQFEALAIKKQDNSDKFNSKFTGFFSEEKRHAKKKALRYLKGISIHRQKKYVNMLATKLIDIEAHSDQKQVRSELEDQLNPTLFKFKQAMSKADPLQIEEIHKLRILGKKLFYQQECLNSLRANSRFQLKNLANVLSVCGRIQNDSVLLGTLDIYLAKKGRHQDPDAMQIKKQVKSHRAKVINTEFARLGNNNWQER